MCAAARPNRPNRSCRPQATLTPRQLDDLQLALSTLPDNGNRLNNRHVLPANNRTFYATA